MAREESFYGVGNVSFSRAQVFAENYSGRTRARARATRIARASTRLKLSSDLVSRKLELIRLSLNFKYIIRARARLARARARDLFNQIGFLQFRTLSSNLIRGKPSSIVIDFVIVHQQFLMSKCCCSHSLFD